MIKETLIYIATYLGLFIASFYIISLLLRKNIKKPVFDETNPPKVSIVIPAYNEEKGIARSIQSALEIDYPKDKLEIIVVDDGSKDKTYEIAKKFESKNVIVLKQEKNSGKGAALNMGIKKSTGEFIVTMDADSTRVTNDALKKMISYFDDSKVMCVSPSMAIYKPRGILQRVQQIEYMMGVFLRSAFSSVDAIHITPGAFSAYRKIFFEKYGGFHEKNLTEDMEMSLRIQLNQFRIVNNPDAVIYTVAPHKFKSLLIQRRRWYAGLLKNLWDYKQLFSRRYGVLGLVVLPIAMISVVISILLTVYISIDSIIKLNNEILNWKNVNFNLFSSLEFNKYVVERYIYLWFSDPITIFFIILGIFFLGYLFFAKSKVKQHSNIGLSLIFFLLFFSFLFVFWWIVSIIYTLFNKKVSWR